MNLSTSVLNAHAEFDESSNSWNLEYKLPENAKGFCERELSIERSSSDKNSYEICIGYTYIANIRTLEQLKTLWAGLTGKELKALRK